MLCADDTPYNDLRHLVLVKRAMQAATDGLAKLREEEARARADNNTSKEMEPLSATMAFLKASERVQVTRME